ncbi:SWI/SNF complex subunit SWI3A [Quillaja saponaria]|uniref:SWI/SNF complex subunit SWI3A n=1 Tax=Quillaja saponaria TaxID=32244 RepID=A0AAD7LFI4_QUISA|nr:SWI/SNF complex subunit SWI3A [Quillaja saponaria]
METTPKDPNSNPIRPDEPELDLYAIPIHSSWFLWDEIHETERIALKEFFDGSSISRTPKIYKEYRDFIINKYREEPTRRLTFTEVRKSLVGDVCLLRKVFLFLEKWGLVNYGAPPNGGVGGDDSVVEVEERYKVKIEEGAPNGIRVVAVPNSLKPISVPQNARGNGPAVESGLKSQLLASYSDVFGDSVKQQELICGNCSDQCDSGFYKYTKGNLVICMKCYRNGNYGEKRSIDDFKLVESDGNTSNRGAVWTEAETILLLESVLKHGDDWELVAQNVQTKTKLDCISKLIELPFGELLLGSSGSNGIVSTAKQVQSSSDCQETKKAEDQCSEHANESTLNGNAVSEGPPSKRLRIAPVSDSSSSLMKQVALISTMVGPHIAAVAAEAAVNALCEESSIPREILDAEESFVSKESYSHTLDGNPKRVLQGEGSEMERSTQSETHDRSEKKDGMPLTLRLRAGVATALGAAAAHAKLLADQEDREIEHLVATIIDTQVGKMQHKIKHFEDLELLMEKEYSEIEEQKESLLEERVDVLQRTFSAGISRWKDFPSIKP